MKKTFRINISGIIFNIDDDAYEKLKQYLNSITRQFIDTSEGNEIISDVECRIAELFQERIADRKEVITLPDIDYIIDVMGKPEDFDTEENDESVDLPEVEIPTKRTSKQIYRDPDNKIISGLSGGLGAYFNIDPVIVRVIFVLLSLFYGTSILIYIILWIVIPEAKSRSQKLEMRGQDITLSNIETSIKREFNQVKSNFENWNKSKPYNKINAFIQEFIETFKRLFGASFKIFGIVFGIFFLLAGMIVLGGTTGMYFFGNTYFSPLSWTDTPISITDFITIFTDSFNAKVILITTYLLFLMPVLGIIYLALKGIFRFKAPFKYIGLYGGTIWSVSLLVLIASSIKIAHSNRTGEEIVQTYKLELKQPDTLYVEVFKDEANFEYHSKNIRMNAVFLEYSDNKTQLLGKSNFTVVRSENENVEMVVKRSSQGLNTPDALQYAKNIVYEWQQEDSVIYLKPYFQLRGEQKFRDQELIATLKIPEGQIIYLGKRIDLLCNYIENASGYSCDEMAGQYWIMTKDGLKLLNGKSENTTTQEPVLEDSLNLRVPQHELKKEIDAMKAELDSM
jgi:phage shock protein PspC (stress-responsive transcriptional regulator)